MRPFWGSIYLQVHDMEGTITWFKEKFDLILGPAPDSEIGDAQLQSRDETVTVVLGAPEKGSGERPMLSTKKAQKAREWLMARGVTAGPIETDRQGTRYFEIRDLEDNMIEIFEEP